MSGTVGGRTSNARARSRGRAPRVLGALLLALALTALAAVPAGARTLAALAPAETQKAPTITKQPAANQIIEAGQPVTFAAAASGNPVPTVQWERSTNGGTNWSNVEGATASTLTIAATSASENGYEFRAVFKNTLGTATTKTALLTVREAPKITHQPASVTVDEGQNATFEAAANGTPAPTVQWQTSSNGGTTWTNVSGATSTTLTLTAVKTTSSGHLYRAAFKNVAGTTDTEAATLTVQKPPAMTVQPLATTAEPGQSAAFEAEASGVPAPTVQWQLSTDGGTTWSNIEGATEDRLTIASVQISENGDEFRAVFTNAAGTVTSNAAKLTVQAHPVVTSEPLSTTVEAGEGASFEATASGFPTPTVQWERSTNGGTSWSAVSGANSDVLTIASTQLAENGYEFRALFTNAAGTATSASATLTVANNHYNAVGWGENVYRELGNGSANSLSNVPLPVSGLKFVESVAAGGRHGLALLANGTLVGWGSDELEQLGQEGPTASTPVAIPGVSGVKAIAAGENHSLALLSNGTVMAWGAGLAGQLGNGKTPEVEGPVAVKGLTGVKAIAAGGNHSLALLSNGTVMAWGENEDGELGDGSLKSSDVPVQVKGLTGATAIAAGEDFSLAVSGGTVKAWGDNLTNQLGDPEVEENSTVPVPVSGLTGVTAVAAGTAHSLALSSTGTVSAWGADAEGQLGDGVTGKSAPTPVAVSGLTGATAIAAGGNASAALLSSGSVQAWGGNQWGTLGNGTNGGVSNVPVTVAGIAKAANISVGTNFMLAFGEPQPEVLSVTPKLGTAAGGTSVTISGVDLTGATAVRFGSAEATFNVESSTTITATTPPGTGTVNVTVVTPSGTSTVTTNDRYTYEQVPTVTKISPNSGPAEGGTTVTITGTEFTAASAVSFGGVAATKYTVNSATSITAVAPAHTGGTADVTVTNIAGTSAISSKDHFKFLPKIESVSPGGGPVAGGTAVTVTGVGFATGTGTIFKFGTAKAKSINCTSSTTCTMLSPPGVAGEVAVTAIVSGAASAASPTARYTYS